MTCESQLFCRGVVGVVLNYRRPNFSSQQSAATRHSDSQYHSSASEMPAAAALTGGMRMRMMVVTILLSFSSQTYELITIADNNSTGRHSCCAN